MTTLDELLAEKTCFSDDVYEKKKRTSTSGTKRFYELIQNNFQFTQEHFNKFITRTTYGKKNSYITHQYYSTSNKADRQSVIIKHMFNLFTPTQKQINQLIACYPSTYDSNLNYTWLETLLARNVPIPTEDLLKIGYNMFEILLKADHITLETLEEAVNKIDDIADLKNIQTIIEKHNLAVSEKLIIYVLRYVREYDYDDSDDESDEEKSYIKRKKTSGKSKKEKPSNKFVFSILTYLLDNKNTVSMTNVLKAFSDANPSKNMMETLQLLLKYHTPTKEDVMNMTDYTHMLYLLELYVEPDTDILNNFIENIPHNDSYWNDPIHTSFKELCTKYLPNSKLMKKYHKLAKTKIMDDTPKDDDDSPSAPSYENGYSLMVKYLIERGAKINQTTLRNLCKQSRFTDAVIDLFKSGHIPDKDCLDNAVHSEKLLKNILDFRIEPDHKTFELLLKTVADDDYDNLIPPTSIELLISHGLKLDRTDIENLILKRVYLKNLDRFNVPYDEDLYFVLHKIQYDICNHDECKEYETYTVNDFSTINQNVLRLRSMCLNNNLNQIIVLMDKEKLQLDIYCLENLVFNKKTRGTARKLIIDNICQPTIRSVGLYGYYRRDEEDQHDITKFLQKLDKIYNVTSKDMVKTIDITTEQLRKFI
jgi:hypothetical protein